MKTRHFALGGAATIALAGMISVMPTASFAQTASRDTNVRGSHQSQPQVSSPAEQQRTRELNLKAAGGTSQTPASLNGVTAPTPLPVVTAPQASNGVPGYQLAQNDNAQQQYQDQQQQYQQQQGEYQDKQNQYDDQKREYDHNIRRYDNARWNYNDYPTAFSYRYDDSPRLRRLYLIAEPSQQLANAPVEGPSGAWVGRIRNVETGVDGRPKRVEIALNRRVSVWVDPGDLRFDADDHVVFTDLTRDQLWQTPGATVESGDSY